RARKAKGGRAASSARVENAKTPPTLRFPAAAGTRGCVIYDDFDETYNVIQGGTPQAARARLKSHSLKARQQPQTHLAPPSAVGLCLRAGGAEPGATGRVAPGVYCPGAPSDPDVRDCRIRLFKQFVRCGL